MDPLGERAGRIVGIDTSLESLRLGMEFLHGRLNCRFVAMDVAALGFADGAFDVVLCLQNGISAFGVDRQKLLADAVRVTRRGGTVLISTYAPRFWEHRLAWFRLQASAGLIGEIDERATADGVIACRDGFKSTTTSPDEFRDLSSGLASQVQIAEVDDSCLFCEITV